MYSFTQRGIRFLLFVENLYKPVEMSAEKQSCHKNLKEKHAVKQMFDNISGHYDFLNRFLSLHIDKFWRRKLVHQLPKRNATKILDVATGTADLAIQASKTGAKKIIGIDLSQKMIDIGKKKVVKKKLDNVIELVQGDVENLPFQDEEFDTVICAFGVRNFYNLQKGLSEIYRVLKHGGDLAILEFSIPKNKIIKALYFFYFTKLLPIIGRIISKHKTAYEYLPVTVKSFPQREEFISILNQYPFKKATYNTLTFGVVSIYCCMK